MLLRGAVSEGVAVCLLPDGLPGMVPGAIRGAAGVVPGMLRGVLPGAVPDGLPGVLIEPGVPAVLLLFMALVALLLVRNEVLPVLETDMEDVPPGTAGVHSLLPEAELSSEEGAVFEGTPDALFCLCLPICWEFTL